MPLSSILGLQGIPASLSLGQNGHRVSGGPGRVCTVAFGLLLSVICGLHPGPMGAGDLDFHGAMQAVPQRLSGELGREAHTGDSFVLLLPWWREGGLSDGEADASPPSARPPPPCLRGAASLEQQERIS